MWTALCDEARPIAYSLDMSVPLLFLQMKWESCMPSRLPLIVDITIVDVVDIDPLIAVRTVV